MKRIHISFTTAISYVDIYQELFVEAVCFVELDDEISMDPDVITSPKEYSVDLDTIKITAKCTGATDIGQLIKNLYPEDYAVILVMIEQKAIEKFDEMREAA